MATNYSPKIVTDGLVLCLDAANPKSYPGSGTTWTDLSKGGNNGTLTNGPTYSSDDKGSFSFDGVDDYVNCNHSLQNNADFSISFWLNSNSTFNSSYGIMSTWDETWNGFGIAQSSANKIRSWARNGAGGGMNWDDIELNTWMHLTLTYNYLSRTQIGYIDSNYKNQEVMLNTSVTHSSLEIARGGKSGSIQLSSYPNIEAYISNILIYNRALTESEIKQNFQATRGRYGI